MDDLVVFAGEVVGDVVFVGEAVGEVVLVGEAVCEAVAAIVVLDLVGDGTAPAEAGPGVKVARPAGRAGSPETDATLPHQPAWIGVCHMPEIEFTAHRISEARIWAGAPVPLGCINPALATLPTCGAPLPVHW